MKQLTRLFSIFLFSNILFGQETNEVKITHYYDFQKREVQESDEWYEKKVETTKLNKDVLAIELMTYDKEEKLKSKNIYERNMKSNSEMRYGEDFHEEGYKTINKIVTDPKNNTYNSEYKCLDKDDKVIFDDKGCIIRASINANDSFKSSGFISWLRTKLSSLAKFHFDEEEELSRFVTVTFVVTPSKKVIVKSIGNTSVTDKNNLSKIEKEIVKIFESMPEKYIPKSLDKLVDKDTYTNFSLPIQLMH